jgi:hypothetical protein
LPSLPPTESAISSPRSTEVSIGSHDVQQSEQYGFAFAFCPVDFTVGTLLQSPLSQLRHQSFRITTGEPDSMTGKTMMAKSVTAEDVATGTGLTNHTDMLRQSGSKSRCRSASFA